jgi:hypothetical protein
MHFFLFLLIALLNIPLAEASTREVGIDRPGSDYFSYTMRAPRDSLCAWRCMQDARCRAWTYVRPGVQGPRARCWLKNAVPAPVRNNCCVSGVK